MRTDLPTANLANEKNILNWRLSLIKQKNFKYAAVSGALRNFPFLIVIFGGFSVIFKSEQNVKYDKN